MAHRRQHSLFEEFGSDSEVQSHKTAMARRGPSSVALALVRCGFVNPRTTPRLIDYGCGRGADVSFYRFQGVVAEGYDPYEPFGWGALPQGTFDIATIVFVLNVVESSEARIDVLRKVSDMLSEGATVAVATRSASAIEREAKKKGWESYSDGYLSDPRRMTFQKGIDIEELHGYLTAAAFTLLPITCSVSKDVSIAFAVKADQNHLP